MKKILALSLCFLLIFMGTSMAFAENPNSNSPSSWAVDYVEKADDMGIFDKSGNSICYKLNIDRESYCELAYQTLEKADKLGNYASVDGIIFNDTSNKKVNSLNKIGIIKGKGNGKFAPQDSLTREEAATILWRMTEYLGCSSIFKADTSFITENEYKDDKSISDWAYYSVYGLLKMGIMNGTDKGFEPKEKYSGEQAITTMVRIMDLISSVNADEKSFADKINSIIPKDSNYMFSPISIKMALALAANGAEGETRNEILDAINVSDLNKFNEDSKTLINNYNKSEVIKLNVANSIWINKSYTDQNFSDSYSKTVKTFYNAESKVVTNENVVKEINLWVNDKTNGKIDSILNDENKEFWTAIINAVYFKGGWMNVFKPGFTKEDDFTDKNGKISQVDFMNKTDYFKYSKTGDVEIVELPYRNYEQKVDKNLEITVERLKNLDVSMYLMMSDKDFDAENTLKVADFGYKYIDFSMPKFKIEYSTSLNSIFDGLGVKKAFTGFAEFGNMFDKGNMFITDCIHKTYINVDEEGTEAAAVTVLEGVGSGLPPERIVVKYNKPFTFVIKDNVNDEILFMGEYLFAS